MKILLSLFLAFSSVFACKEDTKPTFPQVRILGDKVEAKGEMEEKTFTDSFDRVWVSSSIKAQVFHSNENKVIIRAPKSVLENVVVETKEGRVHIRFKNGLTIIGAHNVSAKIYTPQLKGMTIDSSADVVVMDKFTQEEMKISVSSSAELEGTLEANQMEISASSSASFTGKVWALDLQAQVSSSADMLLSGKAKNVRLSASSSGDLNAAALSAETADLQANSSGDIEVGVEKHANAKASSSGDIRILKKGEVIVKEETSSSGKVIVH